MKFKNPLTRDDIFITERPMFRKGMYVYPLRFVVNQNDNLLICPPMKTLFVQFCPTNCTTYIELRNFIYYLYRPNSLRPAWKLASGLIVVYISN